MPPNIHKHRPVAMFASKLIAIAALSICSSLCHAEPKITYVGDGRYSCYGSRSECAATDRHNEQREQLREQERIQREMLEEQRKQTEILEELRIRQRKQD
jgi:hypothetical protein